MSVEQSGAQSLNYSLTPFSYTRTKIGEHFHGFLHCFTKSTWKGLHICSGIDLVNFIIYFILLQLSVLHKWLSYSLDNFSDCMGFPRALLVIGIADFLVHFAKNS